MKGERLTEELARGLAAPTRRRTVLAGLGAGLAVALGAVAGEPEAAAHRRRHPKRCRRPCVNGEVCIDGRCQRDTGPAGRDGLCRTTADCSTAKGPAACEYGEPCLLHCLDGPGNPCPPRPWLTCHGAYDAETDEAASCQRDCECAAGLTCQGGGCRPAAAS